MGDNLRTINWLASFPKSGSTWVRMLYQAHFVGTLDINANLRITYTDALPHNYQAVCSLPLEGLCKEYFVLIRGAALINLMTEASQRPIIVKTHNAAININYTPVIPKEFTKTSVLLVRDPRDVALSYARYINTSVDEAISMMECDTHTLGSHGVVPQYVTSWSLHCMSWKERHNPLVVRYEDMMEDTGHWSKKILEHWGVDSDGHEKAVDMCRLKNLQKQERDKGFVENLGTSKFFGEGGSKWKKNLSAKQVERIEQKHNEMMQEFGYLQ